MAEFHSPSTYDADTGITEHMWYDDTDRKIHVKRVANVSHTYRSNKIQLASSPRDFHKDDGIYHKATIPHIIIEKWIKEEGFNWYESTESERRKKLNAHPEFHVRAGKL